MVQNAQGHLMTPRNPPAGGKTVVSDSLGHASGGDFGAIEIEFDEPDFTPRGTPRAIDAAYMRRKVLSIKRRIGESASLKKKRAEIRKEFQVLEKKEAEAKKLEILAEKLDSDPSGLRRQELETIQKKAVGQLETLQVEIQKLERLQELKVTIRHSH